MRRPEILAPAGDRDALAAALAAGADAIYLGLDDGFNARARATNFSSDDLAATVAWVHRAGARLYVTLNTLVFEPELEVVEQLIRRIAAAGVDAIIVQDPAVAQIARAVCPELELHGSTQMTASSPLAATLLAELGLTRIVVPRELSIEEIRAYAAACPIPLEVFIHGALCVAWSGQCLSSEAWGGRSANRGQCAQACRLPYQLIVDGEPRDLGEVEYLLSPSDLFGGVEAVAALAEIGVSCLKIEGRLKGPQYVAATVAHYRHATALAVGEVPPVPAVEIPIDPASLHVAYSRGGSTGFLAGTDHQTLVEGRFPRHRGVPLGVVTKVDRDVVYVVPTAAQRPHTGGRALAELEVPAIPPPGRVPSNLLEPRAGMGVVFDHGQPEDAEQGGPIFAVDTIADGYRLRFGDPGPDLARVRPGDYVWISSDPRVTRAGDKAAIAGREALGRIAVALELRGIEGAPLEVIARAGRHEARAATDAVLQPARGAGLTAEMVVDKLGGFGGTSFHLGSTDLTQLGAGLHLPVSALKELRRALVAQLDAAIARIDRVVASGPVLDALREPASSSSPPDGEAVPAIVVPLCRTDAQLDAVLDAGAPEVELDWMELVGLGKAVDRARARGARVGVATVRVQKPGEERIDAHLLRLEPDHVLVRSWGSLAYLRDAAVGASRPPALHGDFSLNVTNSITARWVLDRGLATVTAAHDLDRDQLFAMLHVAPRAQVAVTIHHHIPTFHTEHCVYAHLMSSGADYRTCGRPCERHQLALGDRVGLVHPVVVDVGCRNTVFNAQAQSAASLVPALLARGVQRYRIELVRESAAQTRTIYEAYAALVTGAVTPAEVVRRAATQEQFGVTRGTMRTLTVLA